LNLPLLSPVSNILELIGKTLKSELRVRNMDPEEIDIERVDISEVNMEIMTTIVVTEVPDVKLHGFDLMSVKKRREIAAVGGAQVHLMKTAHQLTYEERSRGGQKGGLSTAQKEGHMAVIGQKGGQTAQQKGTAHQLTREERSRGGKRRKKASKC
jgi:hypothetical protein